MNMATPALGPSLGMAPAGTCTVDVILLEARRINAEISGAILYDAERRLRALAHDFARADR